MVKIRWVFAAMAVAMGFPLLGGAVPNSRVMAQPTDPSPQSSPQTPVYTYIREGDRAYADGKYKESIEFYTQALQIFSQNEYAYYNRGNAYRKLKDYPAAIDDYSKALQLNRQNTFSYLYRGMSYLANGESEKAIADYTELLKLDPQSAVAYNRRAEAYLSAQQNEMARADLLKAADLYKKQKEPGLSEKVLSQLRSLKSPN
jgi:tetratricopeptide (TPR) repeat protein